MRWGGMCENTAQTQVPSWSEDERNIRSRQQRRPLDMNKLLLFTSSLLGDRELRKPEDSGLWGLSPPLPIALVSSLCNKDSYQCPTCGRKN